MVDKSELVEQTNMAFNFIQRLYLEVSYLIKEMEAMLSEEDEDFIIGKPSGYGITVRGSTGLEASNVDLWLIRKFAVFFVPKEHTEVKGGQQETKIHDDLKVLYLRIVLQDEKIDEPMIYSGVLHTIRNKGQAKGITKFENLMGHFEYHDAIFKNPEKIEYEDAKTAFKGELVKNPLFEINSSEAIRQRIIKPSLDLYRRY
jgi:hypothetical protein